MLTSLVYIRTFNTFSRRERHAKTLEIAQEEVLTCIGICMYERLHRIYMRMREEECTCQVFAAVAVDALWRSFETAVENKQGIPQLELLYAEFAREEQQKLLRKEQKKLKRKRKKEKIAEQDGKMDNGNECDETEEFDDVTDIDKSCSCSSSKLDGCDCDEMCTSKGSLDEQNDSEKDKSCCAESDCWMADFKPCNVGKNKHKKMYKCDNFLQNSDYKKDNHCPSENSHDWGYSSENNNGYCETASILSSLPSSPEGSEVACSESCCQAEQEIVAPFSRFSYGNGHQLSLQEMLEDHFYCDDGSDCYITPEEVKEFKTNNRQLFERRQQLRETLQKRFAQLCVNGPLQVPRLLVQSKFASN